MVFFCVAACKSNKDGNYRGTWTRIHKDYSDLRLFDWSTVHYFPVTDFLFLLIVNVYSIRSICVHKPRRACVVYALYIPHYFYAC